MYDSYEEIFEQAAVLRKTYDHMLSKRQAVIDFFTENDHEEIVFLACGSSFWGSLSAHITMQRLTGKRCHTAVSGEIVMDPEHYVHSYRKPLIIAPSRSGYTSETLFAVEILKKAYDCKVLAIVEYDDPPLARLADMTIYLPWANERSVCQTRSFNSLYLASLLIASIISDDALTDDLSRFIEMFPELSEDVSKRIKQISGDFRSSGDLVVLGSGALLGTAIEGAYIAIEMSQIKANYYSLLEYRHGPIVTASGDTVLVIFVRTRSRDHEEKIAFEASSHGAKVIAVTASGDLENTDLTFSPGWDASDEVVGLYGTFVMQAFAYFTAVNRDKDPDKPGDLVPFITIRGVHGS